MSAFIKKKVDEQFQEGEVPDDLSDQSVKNIEQPQQKNKTSKDQKQVREQEEFIFQTIPDEDIENDFKIKQKTFKSNADFYQKSQQSHPVDLDRSSKQRLIRGQPYVRNEQTTLLNQQNKRPQQFRIGQSNLPPMAPMAEGYYPIPNPYMQVPQYYPGYGQLPPKLIPQQLESMQRAGYPYDMQSYYDQMANEQRKQQAYFYNRQSQQARRILQEKQRIRNYQEMQKERQTEFINQRERQKERERSRQAMQVQRKQKYLLMQRQEQQKAQVKAHILNINQTKSRISTLLSEIFPQVFKRQQFLYVIRDILKHRNPSETLKDYNKLQLFQQFTSKKESNKKMMSQLFQLFQLDHVIKNFRQKRLRERLIGDRKITQIKKLLEQIVKDPRKRIK